MARKHLGKVHEAWTDPTDWADLTMYGLYALEAAVLAAALHLGEPIKKTHWHKVELARRLHHNNGLPDVGQLLEDLNVARKAEAYGDEERPEDLDAEQIGIEVETFIEAVGTLLRGGPGP
jgi:hypothetical protein